MATKEKMYYDSDTAKTFKEAFAEARKEGQKTFEWNGEKYSTKIKEKDKGPDQSEAETKRLSRKEESDKEDRKPTNRGGAAALAGAGIGLGTAALLSGIRKSEEQRKEREMGRASGKESTRSPVRNISPEEAAFENEGGKYYKKGGKVKKFDKGGSTGSVLTPEQRAEMRQRRDDMAKEKVTPPRGTTKKEADTFKEGIKPPSPDEGPVKSVKKAKGGTASARADGCAIRGKTRA